MTQKPMYQKIADDLRAQIVVSGTLERGAQLPTELELRDQYDASRNTVRDAIRLLMSQGLVETRPGQGTFVTKPVNPFVTELSGDPQALGGAEGATYLSNVKQTAHRDASMSLPKVEIQIPPPEVSRRLRLGPGVQVVSRHQGRYIDSIPWSLQTSFYPRDFVTRGAERLVSAEDIEEGTVRYLANAIDVRQVGYRDWITVRRPDSNEQTFFSLPAEGTVFELFRTAFDQTGTPLRVTVTVFPTDRNQFIINVGQVPAPEYD